MSSDVVIVPIDPPVDDASARALVKARTDNLSIFHTWEADEMRRWMRDQYLKAERNDLVMKINIVINALGTAEGPVRRWNHSANGIAIRAHYDEGTGATEVLVNGVKALTNAKADEEALIAGDWMYVMLDAHRQVEAENRWRAELERNKSRLAAHSTLTAKI